MFTKLPNHNTIQKIKQDVKKLHLLVQEVNTQLSHIEYYNLIEVLLQNVGFDTDASDETLWIEIERVQSILKHFATYYDSYYENWIHSEYKMIVLGNLHIEIDNHEVES